MVICGYKPDRNITFRKSTKLKTNFDHEFSIKVICQFANINKKKDRINHQDTLAHWTLILDGNLRRKYWKGPHSLVYFSLKAIDQSH